MVRHPTSHTAAFERFVRSLTLGFDQWHDGEGYDLGAISQMEEWERPEVVDLMAGRDLTWREVEVLAAIGLPAAHQTLEAAAEHRLSVDTRLAALEALDRQGKLAQPIDEMVARELRHLESVSDGCVRALLLAEQFPTDRVKQALLWASWNRTECAMHCAALLCYLCGVTKEPFDWDFRPLFLRLDPHSSTFERQAAFEELKRLVGMELREDAE